MATSSPNESGDLARRVGLRHFLSLAWAFALLLSVLLNASLLLDVSAFVRFATAFDTLGAAWSTALFGYAGLFAIASRPEVRQTRPSHVTETSGWALLSLMGYTTHLFLLRWPWLSGTAEVGSRLTLWSQALSTTVEGVPWRAFTELLCIAVLLVHACVGALSATAWRRYGDLPARAKAVLLTVALLTYALASSVVVALATGRR